MLTIECIISYKGVVLWRARQKIFCLPLKWVLIFCSIYHSSIVGRSLFYDVLPLCDRLALLICISPLYLWYHITILDLSHSGSIFIFTAQYTYVPFIFACNFISQKPILVIKTCVFHLKTCSIHLNLICKTEHIWISRDMLEKGIYI